MESVTPHITRGLVQENHVWKKSVLELIHYCFHAYVLMDHHLLGSSFHIWRIARMFTLNTKHYFLRYPSVNFTFGCFSHMDPFIFTYLETCHIIQCM